MTSPDRSMEPVQPQPFGPQPARHPGAPRRTPRHPCHGSLPELRYVPGSIKTRPVSAAVPRLCHDDFVRRHERLRQGERFAFSR